MSRKCRSRPVYVARSYGEPSASEAATQGAARRAGRQREIGISPVGHRWGGLGTDGAGVE